MNKDKEVFLQIQNELEAVKKNAKGHNYKYTDLPALWEHLEPVLTKLGIAVRTYSDGEFVITVAEKDGAEIAQSKLPLSFAKGVTPQDLGSAVTYFRRYNLLMMFNVMTEDDDGAKAQKGAEKRTAQVVSNDIILD